VENFIRLEQPANLPVFIRSLLLFFSIFQCFQGKTALFELGEVAGAYLDKVFLDAYYRVQCEKMEFP